MNDDLDRPADTRLMGIAAHLGWMMGFLHRHHETEDTWLYPQVRLRDPAAAPLLDAMDADHQRMGPAITGLTEAAQGYAASPETREELAQALDHLTDVLYPHLRREEDEMMPVVSACVTEPEWREWDQEHNVKPLRPLELADTGLWILDGLDEADRAKVTGLVPPVPRFVITRLLAGRYRRAARRRWGQAGSAAARIPRYGQVEVTTAAAPEAVWAVLSDITRVGEWSHECHSAAWLSGAPGGLGARFRGRNKSGRVRWNRICTITSWQPAREMVWQTKGGATFGDSTEWGFSLEPVSQGTLIRQYFRVLAERPWADRAILAVVPAHHDRQAALRADLVRLAAIAETESARSRQLAG